MDESTYREYLDQLPPDRREHVARVWQVVRSNLKDGFEESLDNNFLTVKARGEWYIALANQKRYISIYLMPAYAFPDLKSRLETSGKKLKMGKSCINFTRADDLPLDVLGEIVGFTDAATWAAEANRIRTESKQAHAAQKAAK